MIILNNLVNTSQRMEQEKNTDIDEWKIMNKTVHSFFFIRTILKEQWDLLENKKIRTIKAKINTKNVLSKLGKQKCTVTNK